MAEIQILETLKAAPRSKTQIYTLKPPAVGQKALLQLAQPFEPSQKGRFTQDPTKLTYTDGPHLFTLYRASGAFRYQDQTRWQRDDGAANLEIQDAEAVKLAQRVVGEYELAPLNELQLLKVTRLNVGSSGPAGGKPEQRVIDVGVAFQRTIGGVPVDGPGGKVIIYLDHEGKPTGFDRTWRQTAAVYKPVESLISPQAAQSQLQRYWRAQPGTIQVTGARFGYFERGRQETQRYIQPAYVFLLRLMSPEQRMTMNTAFVVAAATNAVGTIMPPPKKPVAQPLREGK
jgi:hypothetical protein